jgi:hypothetical protein
MSKVYWKILNNLVCIGKQQEIIRFIFLTVVSYLVEIYESTSGIIGLKPESFLLTRCSQSASSPLDAGFNILARRIMADYFVVQCNGRFYTGRCQCNADYPYYAYRFRSLDDAKDGAKSLNDDGCCGGNCFAATISETTSSLMDEKTGMKIKHLSFSIKLE